MLWSYYEATQDRKFLAESLDTLDVEVLALTAHSWSVTSRISQTETWSFYFQYDFWMDVTRGHAVSIPMKVFDQDFKIFGTKGVSMLYTLVRV